MRVLEDCNIKLSCVVSDTSGVTATSLINMICDGKTLTLEDIKGIPPLTKPMNNGIDEQEQNGVMPTNKAAIK